MCNYIILVEQKGLYTFRNKTIKVSINRRDRGIHTLYYVQSKKNSDIL